MSVIWFILFGFIIGLLARALVPGRQGLGIVQTLLLGVAGSLAGGFVSNAIAGAPLDRLQPAGFIGSLIGAIVLLLIYGAITKKRRQRAHP